MYTHHLPSYPAEVMKSYNFFSLKLHPLLPQQICLFRIRIIAHPEAKTTLVLKHYQSLSLMEDIENHRMSTKKQLHHLCFRHFSGIVRQPKLSSIIGTELWLFSTILSSPYRLSCSMITILCSAIKSINHPMMRHSGEIMRLYIVTMHICNFYSISIAIISEIPSILALVHL